jgi:hypothetical protein
MGQIDFNIVGLLKLGMFERSARPAMREEAAASARILKKKCGPVRLRCLTAQWLKKAGPTLKVDRSVAAAKGCGCHPRSRESDVCYFTST